VDSFITDAALVAETRKVCLHGARPPVVPKRRVVVDFSSPNIAKGANTRRAGGRRPSLAGGAGL
jgi:hypothetical protein